MSKYLLALPLAALAMPASAAVMVCTTPNCAPTDDNVMVIAGTAVTSVGATVGTATGAFTSTTEGANGLTGNASGQAFVSAVDGVLNQLTFMLDPGYGFKSAVFNLNPLQGNNNSEAGAITLSFFDPATNTLSTQQFTIQGNGSNWFGFWGTAGEVFRGFSYTSDNPALGIADMRQVRLGDVSAVPEPATWAFLILGFGAVGGAMRRRSSIRLSFKPT